MFWHLLLVGFFSRKKKKRFRRAEGTLEKPGKCCKVTAHICIYLYEDYNDDNPSIALKHL